MAGSTDIDGVELKEPGKYAGVSEVQMILGAPRSSINRWIANGVMPQPLDKLAATWVWRRSDIEAFARSREADAVAAAQE